MFRVFWTWRARSVCLERKFSVRGRWECACVEARVAVNVYDVVCAWWWGGLVKMV